LTGGDAWQAAIFAAAIDSDLASGRAFSAVYLSFLGRTNGPRAGWLLANLDPGFVVRRLREAAGTGAGVGAGAAATTGGPA
jgi:lysyl-tRNA synthetase class I